jgi:hypothetical protein
MSNQDSQPSSQHKEEGAERIRKDAEDRVALRNQLAMSLHPLKEPQPTEHLINIASGEVVRDASVNVFEAYNLGTLEMTKFGNKCPDHFHEPIKKTVVCMNVAKKHVKINENIVIDPEVIYARAMAIQNSPNPIKQTALVRTGSCSNSHLHHEWNADIRKIGTQEQAAGALYLEKELQSNIHRWLCHVVGGRMAHWQDSRGFHQQLHEETASPVSTFKCHLCDI